MVTFSTEKCLAEETPKTNLSINQCLNSKDEENKELIKKNEENQQPRECMEKSSVTRNHKKRTQMVTRGEGVPKWFSQRWIFCYVSFVGMFFCVANRVGITVAIVSMVKKKAPLNETNLTIDPSCNSSIQHLDEEDRGEFEWSELLVANILGGFYYGYTLTNVLGGILADRYGGRRVLGYTLLSSSLLLLIYPVLSRVSGYWTLTLRVLSGLLAGPINPSMKSLWGRWAPPIERGRLMTISSMGHLLGAVVTLPISGYLCAYGFDNGWGSVFYLSGSASFLYSLFWFYLVYDNPQKHPRITIKEREFLEKAIQCQSRAKNFPWKSMLKSGAVWAIIAGHFCSNWSSYTVETMLPMFMKEVLYFDIKANGFMSSIPSLGMLLSFTFIGTLADFLIRRGYLTVRGTRVLMQCTSFVGSAIFFIATSFVKCSNAMMAVWFLFFAGMFIGFSGAGHSVNHVDIAPTYAGSLYGVTNTVSSLSGFLAPTLAGALTPNGTQEEWQKVFFVCSAFAVFGAVVFAILAKGDVQEWAIHSHEETAEKEVVDDRFSEL